MKRIAITLFVCSVVVLCAYLTLWIYSARYFKQEINNLYAQAADNNLVFLGAPPVLTGFPFVPEVYYTGGLQTGDIIVRFPEVRVKGYPIPRFPLHIDFPQGIALDGTGDPGLWSLDTLSAILIVPTKLPQTLEERSLRGWQQRDGKIDVPSYTLTKNGLTAEGNGSLSLDPLLQPVFSFESTLKGYEGFVQYLLQNQMISPMGAMAASGLLTGLSRTDPLTNENTVQLSVSVQNQILTVGPFQLVRLPTIVWDPSHTAPVPHQ